MEQAQFPAGSLRGSQQRSIRTSKNSWECRALATGYEPVPPVRVPSTRQRRASSKEASPASSGAADTALGRERTVAEERGRQPEETGQGGLERGGVVVKGDDMQARSEIQFKV